jgi:hypothetical protein
MCNHFLNNEDKQDWEVQDYNVRLATHAAKMQSHFMFYLSYVVNDAEEQAARDEFNRRLIKTNEVLGLANALAQIEENDVKNNISSSSNNFRGCYNSGNNFSSSMEPKCHSFCSTSAFYSRYRLRLT